MILRFTFKLLLTFFLFIRIIVSQENQYFVPENKGVIIDSLNKIKYSNPELALRFAFKTLEKYPINTDDKTVLGIYNTIGEIFLKKGNTIQALEYLIEADRESKRLNIGGYWIAINMGNVYYQEKKWLDAEEKYIEAYEIVSRKAKFRGPEKINVMSLSLLNRAMIYMELNDYEKSFNLIVQSIEMKKKLIKNFPNLNPYGGIAYHYTHLIKLYLEWDMIDYALKSSDSCRLYLDKYLEQITSKNDKDIKGNINKQYKRYNGIFNQRLGTINIKKEDFKKGLSYYMVADKEFDLWPIDKVNNFMMISDIFAKEEPYKALDFIDQGLIICKINNLKLQEIELLQKKSDIFKNLNISKSALEIEEMIKNKIIQMREQSIEDNLKNLELKEELYVNRNLLLGAEARLTFLILISGSIFVVLGTLALYLRNKNKQAEELMHLSKENEIYSKELLLNKENELVQMSTFLVSKNEFINNISRDLEYHVSLVNNKNEKKSFSPLMNKLKNELNTSRDWQNFQKQFANLYPDFIKDLTNKYKDLTSNDVKVCCYLKMNQSTKDIAQLTGLSIRAIENRRYRLRKKLDLGKEMNLINFLHTF